ncbi:MAG: glycosyltransferase family 4 protein [Cytophagaceae bacterium]
MRIAQVSPLFESVPPKLYGGTERIVSYLTEELVKRGHEVTLFASGDSQTSARLVSPWCCALRLHKECLDQVVHHFTMMEMVQMEIENFDIVHYHIDYLHFPLSSRSRKPNISTVHGRLDIPDLVPLYNQYKGIPLVSISNFQQKPFPDNNWVGNVYHGLPQNLYNANYNNGKYLAFVGRFSRDKRPDRAIELAIRTGIPIKLAAKIGDQDIEYYESVVKPLLNHPLVEFVGEIGESEKNEFLGNALALVFLIDWPEPFGLVMIEAMACGTPVVAWRNGSVPEVIDDGVSGIVVDSMDEAIHAMNVIGELDRRKVRETFEMRFSVEKMTDSYLQLYQKMIEYKSVSEIKI